MSGYRLAEGGRINRDRPVTVRFDGAKLGAFEGDTLASALIANGRQLVGRSFKYHRPRGILSSGADEPNALMTLRTGGRAEPNIQATMVEVHDGLEARSQNAWPSLGFDVMAANSLLAPVFSAGFYYKTFMGPTARSWMLFEPIIRRAAGLGRAPAEADPDVYDRRNHFCDVLVVGGGPAGLMAALGAARAGARVTLADDRAQPGGALCGSAQQIDGAPADVWVADVLKELAQLGARVMTRTSVFGYFDNQTLGAVERVADHVAAPAAGTPRQRFWTIRAGQVVLAAGAFERPLVFPGNDTPGVMLASAVRRYADLHGVACGRRIVIVTNNDSGYGSALALADRGIGIAAIVDSRPAPGAHCAAAAKRIGCAHHTGHVVQSVRGGKALRAVWIAPRTGGRVRDIDCDCVAMSGGWTPTVHLASQMGSPPVHDDSLRSFLPGKPAPTASWIAAGAMNGALSTADCLAQGAEAGADAAGKPGKTAKAAAVPTAAEEPFLGYDPDIIPAVPGKGKVFVDFQNDVAASDVKQAAREGFRSVEHLKRYTTLGMATDQGKVSNVNAIAILAEANGRPVPEVGTTRFRPPYTPVTIAAIVGRHRGAHIQAVRRTPMQDWHEENGGVMSEVGLWKRPRAYLRGAETLREAYIREARNVRAAVGICDVSTLGKIDVQGPDAAEFLNRVYSNPFAKVVVGKARYGVMLRDDGMVLDDGTSWRLSETQFLMTTTTGGAGTVMQHLERLLSLFWPDLRVTVASTTGQWAGMSLAGPNARKVLEKLVPDADLSDAALSFMGLLRTECDGVPVLIARLSFSGELAFEVFSGADHGLWVWTRLLELGQEFGIMPYGTEALGTLRIEKGHVAGGELDGRVSAQSLGLGGMLSEKKDFFGSRLCRRDGLLDPERYELVGLIAGSDVPLRAGAHVVIGEKSAPGPSQGFVSSTTYSPALDKEIALALVKGGAGRIGSRMFAADPVHGTHQSVDVVSPHFYDPDGTRMRT